MLLPVVIAETTERQQQVNDAPPHPDVPPVHTPYEPWRESPIDFEYLPTAQSQLGERWCGVSGPSSQWGHSFTQLFASVRSALWQNSNCAVCWKSMGQSVAAGASSAR